MAYFAKLDENNIVTQVEHVNNSIITDSDNNEQEHLGQTFLRNLHNEPSAIWKKGSYNTREGSYRNPDNTVATDQTKKFRINYPSIGMKYDSTLEGFVEASCIYDSWTLNNTTGYYEAPTPMPETYTDGSEIPDSYAWDETTTSWIKL